MAACGGRDDGFRAQLLATDPGALDAELNPIAEAYVRLVLAVGTHDSSYVDAYYGPAEWQDAARSGGRTLPELQAEADSLLAALQPVPVDSLAQLARLRHWYLTRQLQAVRSYIGILGGDRPSFEEESRALYDAVAPSHPEAHFRTLLDSLAELLPGTGPLPARLERFRQDFIIPRARLDTVFRVAIAEARRRTAAHVPLPAGEDFRLEYVGAKPWSGYNWYQGAGKSLIQINTDLPIHIERAVDLGAHEGYPGHHVYNALLEQTLVRGRGWPEYSVYPLFSPQSLIAEGSANYGIELAFPEAERLAFERDVLFPLAGLDPDRTEEYQRVRQLVERLAHAGNEAARQYVDGAIDADAAARWLHTYALYEPERARQRVRFIAAYRSYVINYNHGKDLVQQYVEARAGADPDRRWAVFAELLASPRLPSGLEIR
ncbi:MAG: hypothetical protein FIB01_15825 [Gemmatimonadetes bacterium]|nr:hypothetical protein [Gemmatimonadota bacterium]